MGASKNPSNGTNKGNYFEFDQNAINGVPLGTYEWSIVLFEGEISEEREYKLARMRKTTFGPTAIFTRE